MSDSMSAPAPASVRRIAVLPTEVVERIAAGEVIERPASVVRELLDNALDAGSRTIRLEISDGGLRMIRVVDDGCGIAPDQLELACRPHTTSKLRTSADLLALTTLGFRGEALASIAAVAELEIVSAMDESGIAVELTLRPGCAAERSSTARPRGTTVVVRDLFAHIPARAALMLGPHREAARVLSVVRTHALCHPDVRFTLVQDGRLVLRSPGTGLLDALTAVYGSDAGRSMMMLDAKTGDASVSGYVCGRGFTQPSREHVVVAINGRPVTNRLLLHAAESGYRPLLRKGRHPLLVANITVPPASVDATIHPAKAQVLLREEREIASKLRDAVHRALGNAPGLLSSPAARPVGVSFNQPVQLRLPVPPKRRRPARLREGKRQPLWYFSHADMAIEQGITELRCIGQLDNTLILAEAPNGSLYVIDQHRAHERILYEHLCADRHLATLPSHSSLVGYGYMKTPAAAEGASRLSVPAQLPLEPVLVQLTPPQAAVLATRLDTLAALGLECQPFGGATFLVRTCPTLAGAAQQPWAFVAELASDAAEDTDEWLDHVCISLACRSAVRRGQVLAPAEQQALIADLRSVSAPAVCPHGSPLILRQTREHMARLFEW